MQACLISVGSHNMGASRNHMFPLEHVLAMYTMIKEGQRAKRLPRKQGKFSVLVALAHWLVAVVVSTRHVRLAPLRAMP